MFVRVIGISFADSNIKLIKQRGWDIELHLVFLFGHFHAIRI